jgi:hypothetical protein
MSWWAGALPGLRRSVRLYSLFHPPVPARAVLDSGAEATCIDSSLVQTLGMPPKGFTLANLPTAGGLTVGTEYDISLTVLHPSGNARLHLVVSDLVVVELALGVLGYQALIGRDVLAICKFLYHGPRGRFRLSY